MYARTRTTANGSKGKRDVPAHAKKPVRSGKQRLGKVVPRSRQGTGAFAVKSTGAAAGTGTDREARRAIGAVKLVGVLFQLREQKNHLQGLYAEAGKIVYEHQVNGHRVKSLLPHLGELFHRVAALRKKVDQLEREARALKHVAYRNQC